MNRRLITATLASLALLATPFATSAAMAHGHHGKHHHKHAHRAAAAHSLKAK